MPIAVDRFGLLALADALDRDCFKRAVGDLREAIDPAFWEVTMKVLLRDAAALLLEFQRDYDDLQRLVCRDDIFAEHSVIPGPEEIERDIPKVYITAEEHDRIKNDPELVIGWHVRRVAWVCHTFIQMQGQFTGLVRSIADSPDTVEMPGPTPGSSVVVTGNSPDFMHEVVRRWYACRRLVGEYLVRKSELLVACGHDVARLSLNLGYRAENMMAAADDAVLKADPLAAQALLNAFRWAVVEGFGLRERVPPPAMAACRPIGLYAAVTRSGFVLSSDPTVLGNVLVSLEHSAACGEPMPISDLYPFARLVHRAFTTIGDLAVGDTDKDRVAAAIMGTLQPHGEMRPDAED